ncbi:MAG TPA: hypothetical protein VEA99_17020, partial [Gemmatimonadaceae bacterium]|nr:hypothetical protein [Gemmatimonadaceae bacterium]
RPPAPGPEFTLRGVELPTFEADTPRVFRRWGVGPHLPYAGIVRVGGAPRAGVEVVIRRTGGIAVRPEEMTVRTNDAGAFSINPVPLGVGELVVSLTFRPPAPLASFTVTNLRLVTDVEDYREGTLVWTWDLDKPPTGPPGTQITARPGAAPLK